MLTDYLLFSKDTEGSKTKPCCWWIKFWSFKKMKPKIAASSIAKEDNAKPYSAQSLPTDVGKHGKTKQVRALLNSLVRVLAGNEQVWSCYSMLLNTSSFVKINKYMNKFLEPGSLLKTVQPISRSITWGSLIQAKPWYLLPKDMKVFFSACCAHVISTAPFLLVAGALSHMQMF